jgi:ribosomal 50S subunit-recycling heat shock protein
MSKYYSIYRDIVNYAETARGCDHPVNAGPTRAANLLTMRLDKFMKVSRLAKRRSEAHEALEHGRITKGGRTLKPGYQVKPGDELEIHYATKLVTVRIREVPLRVTPGLTPSALYEILDSRKDESDWL